MILSDFKICPVIGILRGIDPDMIHPIAEISIASGLRAIEITMNTENAPSLIKSLIEATSGRLAVGAGTVLSLKELKMALDAGASFIVSPVLVDEVAGYCVKEGIPFFPGALTPQEIFNAWRAGAAMVKIFPASVVGPAYFKEIKGPFNDIELLACGGVNALNIKDYFLNHASAVAFGTSIFKLELLKNREYQPIISSIKTLLSGLTISIR